jgi:hypothetical protein
MTLVAWSYVRPFLVFEVGIVTRTYAVGRDVRPVKSLDIVSTELWIQSFFLHLVTYIATPTVPTLEYYVRLSVITAYSNALQRSNATPASSTGRAVLYAKCHITSRVVNWPLAFTRHIATLLSILTCFY